MNLAQTFEAARPLAQHCAELTDRGPRPEEREESIAAWRSDIGRVLTQELAAQFSGEKIAVAVGEPERLAGKEVFDRIGRVAANTLLRCGTAEQTALLSFDFATAVALTDLSFGGDGATPDSAPETLPRSASMLVDQLATAIAVAVASASGWPRERADVIIRSESASRLKPFGTETRCALFSIKISSQGQRGWQAVLAFDAEDVDRLLPDPGAANFHSTGGSKRKGDGLASPFSDIPLALNAVLAELNLSLSELDQLKPGDCIPIAVPQDVPLRTSGMTFAHGKVGTNQDQMALQLTRTTTERSFS